MKEKKMNIQYLDRIVAEVTEYETLTENFGCGFANRAFSGELMYDGNKETWI